MMHALRLHPGDELMSSLKQCCSENNLRAAYIATCVGSLQACTLRLANADRDRPNEIKTYDQRFEIVSVVGTISCEGAHIHLGLADATGASIGGHLISATVFTTAEIVLGEVPCITFDRQFDDATGFKELVVVRRELAAATTSEDHKCVRAAKLVTAATTDVVAAALIVLELYAQTNQWPLVENAGIDGGAVREMARKFLDKPALEEVTAWSGEQLAAWLGSHQKLVRLQDMALDGSLTIGALLDAGVAGAAPLGVKMTVGAKGFLRLAVRRELPTLVMPPPLAEMVTASLHAEVKERPHDAKKIWYSKFGEWCEAANLIRDVEVCATAILSPSSFQLI